jgi:hypothetical protein
MPLAAATPEAQALDRADRSVEVNGLGMRAHDYCFRWGMRLRYRHRGEPITLSRFDALRVVRGQLDDASRLRPVFSLPQSSPRSLFRSLTELSLVCWPGTCSEGEDGVVGAEWFAAQKLDAPCGFVAGLFDEGDIGTVDDAQQ